MFAVKSVDIIETVYFGLEEYIKQKNGKEIHRKSPIGKENREIFYTTKSKCNGENKINIFKKTYDYLNRETVILKSEQVTFSEKDLQLLKNLEIKTEIYEIEPNGKKYGATVYAEKKGNNLLVTKENFGYEGMKSKIFRIEKIEIPEGKISKLEKILKE